MNRNEDEFDDLPEALIEELRSADRSLPLITARVDREVLNLAREQFAVRRPAWRRPAWAAVAAAVVLAVLMLPQHQMSQGPALLEAPQPRSNYLESRKKPDISDVLRLARQTQGEPRAQAEIDALAYRVVALRVTGVTQ